MTTPDDVADILASRADLPTPSRDAGPERKDAAEGGCGVIGLASSEALPGRHLLRALEQMRNRGNGKGGGVAAVGLDPDQLDVPPDLLREAPLLTVAYLDPDARDEVEEEVIEPAYDVHAVRPVPTPHDWEDLEGLETRPPDVVRYLVTPRDDAVDRFADEHDLAGPDGPGRARLEDEFVYRTSYRLNHRFYRAGEETRAFVLSHGRNMMVLKMVGYGDDVVRYYGLEDVRAHVWIGHHRYPTKGRVWHPGGAHPFVGLHEALVHNGDFANYHSVCEFLAQRNIYPLFLTDTEVSVLVFDLLHRTYGYPLEHVIETLAPTTERDFTRLPDDKRRTYRALQQTHMHGSPDGPWFFLIARSKPPRNGDEPEHELLGITDTSMLRPQVFALQEAGRDGDGPAVGLAASEKQGIDAALASLSDEDPRFWPRADAYWVARGGSHTDGGAFRFTVRPDGDGPALVCRDKFGEPVRAGDEGRPRPPSSLTPAGGEAPVDPAEADAPAELFERVRQGLPEWGWSEVDALLDRLADLGRTPDDRARDLALGTLTLLVDRRYDTGGLRRSNLLARVDAALEDVVAGVREAPSKAYVGHAVDEPVPEPGSGSPTVVVDARGFPQEGGGSLARRIVELEEAGFQRIAATCTRGHRFLGNGLGAGSHGLRLDVYGSPGDYLGSGLDGADVAVHGTGQDQLAQIMRGGRLTVHGDVGQTFMYGAEGGDAWVLGDAAGRPLINAVGSPRVVINGTCLDYLAESFMAGDPHDGGGFVVLNGMEHGPDGRLRPLETPYPGGNLFSLASGGALYVRDPHRVLTEDQLNGGEFAPLADADWDAMAPVLEENERRFGIPVRRLLTVDGETRSPRQVYRRVQPGDVEALQPEEAWVKGGDG